MSNQFFPLFQSQKDRFNSNETKDVSFRISQLKKLKSLIKENEQPLFDAIYKDFGKSDFETFITEIGLIYDELNTLIKKTKKWSRPKRVKAGLTNVTSRAYIMPEPLGVTCVIGASNYPYMLSLIPSFSALAAGNTVILKPSELAGQTAKAMSTLINTNFPPDYFHVVEGGVPETTSLLQLPFDKIFFTGSTRVGKIVYEAAAKNLTPVTLELGGKSPTFVFADCPIEMTAQRIVWGKFLNAGQTCVAPDYLLVEKSIESKFINALKRQLDIQHQAAAELPENYVRIITKKQFDQLKDLIDPEKVCYGGEVLPEKQIITPTLLTDVTFDDEIMKREIFGPILPILTFDHLDDVLPKVKAMPKPLACYIYTRNNHKIKHILTDLSFGGGCINDNLVHLSAPGLPFGGVGHSGMGSYHGKAGFDTFSHYKSILHNNYLFEPPFKYPPYTKVKWRIFRWLFK